MMKISPFKLIYTYQKPTDARHYLSFNSCHTNYTFSGVIYSQGMRLRRIINNDERLASRLKDLKADFIKCHYPSKLLEKIFTKVTQVDRTLAKRSKADISEENCVRVVTTNGRDKSLSRHSSILKRIQVTFPLLLSRKLPHI